MNSDLLQALGALAMLGLPLGVAWLIVSRMRVEKYPNRPIVTSLVLP